jgi:hypothetical protein
MSFRAVVAPAPLVGTLLVCLFATLGRAQVVNLSGNVHNGAGGPLQAGVVYHVLGAITVPAGTTLTVAAGAIVKFGPGTLADLYGTLTVDGTAANPAFFTSIQDDSKGGDTNGNGPSVGSPGDWIGLRFQDSSDSSVLTGAVLRFAGGSGFPGVLLLQADIALQSCEIASCGFDGLRLQGDPRPTVTGCRFLDNRGVAVNTSLDAIPGFLNNQATGNAGGDYQRVNLASITTDRTIGTANLLDDVLVLANPVSVPVGRTLTLGPGVIVKLLANFLVDVDGTLLAQGTASRPVVFTSFADDAFGGDTNQNGPSTGSPGDWFGVRLRPNSGNSVLDHVLVRFAGYSAFAGVLAQSDCVLRHTTIESSALAGLQLQVGQPTVRNCVFRDNGGTAVVNVPLSAVARFFDNSATGNATGDFIDVNANPTVSCAIEPSNLINGVLVLSNGCTVPSGVAVTLEQGVIVKMRSSLAGIFVDGRLDVLGSGFEPVVFTSFADDEYGGDTNKNGPSTGAPGQWLGIRYHPSTLPSRCQHALLRFGGNAGYPGFQGHSRQLTLRSVRVERGATSGFYLTAHSTNVVPNLVAWANGGDGFTLGGGGYEVQYSTTANNGGAGFRGLAANAFVGNSISWSNAGGDVVGIGCVNCNLQDPIFRNAAIGDLQLTHNGPMVDQGDVLYAIGIVSDFLENSRLLDDDLNSSAVPDLGAYELCWWDMQTSGVPRPGARLGFTVLPHLPVNGISVFVFGGLDGQIYAQPWGFVLVGSSPLVLGAVAIGTPLFIDLPTDPSIVGLRGGIQALAAAIGSPGLIGTMTRLYRIRVRP